MNDQKKQRTILREQQNTQKSKQRTLRQNSAMHAYFGLVAEALNDAGYDIKKTLEHYKIEVPWTTESVKNLIWREVQKSMFDKVSTTELERGKEITKIYEVINRFLGQLGIEHIPFPSEVPDYE